MNAFTTAFAAKVAQLQAEARDNHYKKSRQTAEYLGDITFDAVSMINKVKTWFDVAQIRAQFHHKRLQVIGTPTGVAGTAYRAADQVDDAIRSRAEREIESLIFRAVMAGPSRKSGWVMLAIAEQTAHQIRVSFSDGFDPLAGTEDPVASVLSRWGGSLDVSAKRLFLTITKNYPNAKRTAQMLSASRVYGALVCGTDREN